MKTNNKIKGIAAAALSAILFGTNAVICKFGFDAGWNEGSITCMEAIFVCLIAFILCKSRKITVRLKKDEILPVAAAAIMNGLTMLLYNTASGKINAGATTALHFIYPALIIISEIIFFSSRAGWIKILSAVLNIAGVFFFFERSGDMLIGSLIAIASAVCYTIYSILTERSKAGDLEPIRLTFYIAIATTVIGAATALASDGLRIPGGAVSLIWPLLLGLSSDLCANVLYQTAISNIGATQTSLTSTLEPLTSVILGVIFFAEAFVLKTFFGCVLIVAAILLNSISTLKEDNKSGVASHS